MIFDSYNEHFSTYNLSIDEQSEVNKLNPLVRGTFIYDSFRSNN